MARPRLIRTEDGGEISLKNVNPQLAAAIADLVAGKEAAVVEAPAVASAPSNGLLNNKALGICKNLDGTLYQLAEISFNAATKEARVDNLTVTGDDKESAASAFKIAAVNNNIV